MENKEEIIRELMAYIDNKFEAIRAEKEPSYLEQVQAGKAIEESVEKQSDKQ